MAQLALTVVPAVVAVRILGKPNSVSVRLQLHPGFCYVFPRQMFQGGPKRIRVRKGGIDGFFFLAVGIVLEWANKKNKEEGTYPCLSGSFESQHVEILPLDFAREVTDRISCLDEVFL